MSSTTATEFGAIEIADFINLRYYMKSDPHDIIVIGASAGGVRALRTIASALPGDLPAAVFIAMHIPSWLDSKLPEFLTLPGPLRARHPISGEPIEHGRIYVAPPDRHLLINSDDRIELSRGPKENKFRPSIDALFRSAALAYGPRVTGVILSGMLEDGATGLWWVKRMGGISVVQDPDDAQFPDMPEAALIEVKANYIAPTAEIPKILADVVRGVERHPKKEERSR